MPSKNRHLWKRKKFSTYHSRTLWGYSVEFFKKKINNSHNLFDTVNSTSINLAEYTLSGHRGQGSTAEGGGKIDKTLFRGMKCLCLSLFAALRAFNLQQGGLLHPSPLPCTMNWCPRKFKLQFFSLLIIYVVVQIFSSNSWFCFPIFLVFKI